MLDHGAVIGKFDPPHLGHTLLINRAAASCARVTVIVCHRSTDWLPGELREAWLRELHPGVEVMLIDDTYPDDDSQLWADNTVRWLGHAPDAVFTSESYGDPWAAALGCRHVLVDRQRSAVPISATVIRADPFAHWEFLSPPVRAHLTLRVVVLGAESTGTTTLAQALARHYDTAWVPEYGREYSETKLAAGFDVSWATAEFVTIASEQATREDALARQANRVLICDTDPFATGIWHERYMGSRSAGVEAVAAGRRIDLHILTAPDIPFVQDGLRDGERHREWMHSRFAEALRERGGEWLEVSGTHEARMTRSTAAIDRLLAWRPRIPPPRWRAPAIRGRGSPPVSAG